MDLSRAKTILIVAFLALNLFLSYRLWFVPQFLQAGRSITGQEVESARELLEEHGYEVLAAIPREVPSLSLLHVSREQLPPSAWVEAILGEDMTGVVNESGNIQFEKGDETVEVASNGQVFYQRQGAVGSSSGQEGRLQLAESFLRERQLWQDDLKYDAQWTLSSAAGTQVSFVQTHQGFPLFFSTVDVYIADGAVYAANVHRVEPLGFSNQEIQVISAVEAIDAFIELAEGYQGMPIEDISLGYFSADYDAERWEIVPVWRIATSDGTTFYINAFTGENETISMQ